MTAQKPQKENTENQNTDSEVVKDKKFPPVYWLSIFFEFIERGAYYGVMSILSVYMITEATQGGLGFDKITAGAIKSITIPILYGMPIISGALADRFGYKKTLLVAFALLGTGYALMSQSKAEVTVFLSLVIFALGAGTFKPVISGTIAKTTNESNSSLGFGIFYWSINFGAFVFPLILVPYLKEMGWQYIFIASSIATAALLIPGFLFYKEPPGTKSNKSIATIMMEAVGVLKDIRFISLIVIYSGFWILYFQMFDTVLWYLRDHLNMEPVNNWVNGILSAIGSNIHFRFDSEHVTVINAGTIIALQLIISAITKNTKPLPTMVTGILLGTIGMGMLALSPSPWLFIAGLILFSIGEMTAHPKFLSYVGLIAPKEKVGTYMGYSFLYGVIGTSVGSFMGAKLYVYYVDKLHNPKLLWLTFLAFGLATIIGLLIYNKIIQKSQKQIEQS